MILQTKYFGEIDAKEEEIISFKNGLLGFEDIDRYVLIDNEEEGSPFKWLQGVNGSKPAFVIIDPFAVKNNYEINLSDEVLKELDIKDAGEVVVYSIVVVP